LFKGRERRRSVEKGREEKGSALSLSRGKKVAKICGY